MVKWREKVYSLIKRQQAIIKDCGNRIIFKDNAEKKNQKKTIFMVSSQNQRKMGEA